MAFAWGCGPWVGQSSCVRPFEELPIVFDGDGITHCPTSGAGTGSYFSTAFATCVIFPFPLIAAGPVGVRWFGFASP